MARATAVVVLVLLGCSGSEFDSAPSGGAGGTAPSGGGGSSGSGSGGVAGNTGGTTTGGVAGSAVGGSTTGGASGMGGSSGAGASGGTGGSVTAAKKKLYSPNSPVGLAVSGQDLYWGSDVANDVKRAPKDGSAAPTALVKDGSAVYYVGILGTELFWTNGAKDCKKISLAGSGASVVEPGLGDPWGIALASGKAFVAESADSKIAVLDAVNGGEKLSFALPASSSPEGIATDGTTLYVALHAGGQVVSMPIAGGNPTFFASGEQKPSGVAVDSASVYWATQSTPGRLRKKAKAGGAVVDLATDLAVPTGVAVDATYVYVADHGANAIYRLPK